MPINFIYKPFTMFHLLISCTEYSAECAVGSLKEMFIHPYQNMLQVNRIKYNYFSLNVFVYSSYRRVFDYGQPTVKLSDKELTN